MQDMQGGHYGRFGVMVGLHFVAMYILMYAMVNQFSNVFHSLNQFYMAGLMTASMVLIELPLMGSMYPDRKRNLALIAVGLLALIGFWFGIRQQTFISDRQFLRSMIPHHSGAILMCQEASLRDPELKKLCAEIVEGQQAEIDLMKRKLAEAGN